MNLVKKFSDATTDLYNNHPKAYAAILGTTVVAYVAGQVAVAKKISKDKPNPYHV